MFKVTASDDLRKLEDIGSSGLQVEYRCSRCRDCVQCRGSDQTEKTSLREDADAEPL